MGFWDGRWRSATCSDTKNEIVLFAGGLRLQKFDQELRKSDNVKGLLQNSGPCVSELFEDRRFQHVSGHEHELGHGFTRLGAQAIEQLPAGKSWKIQVGQDYIIRV